MYLSQQIALLHSKPIKWYITATGAGSGVQRFLSLVPGGSNTIIGCEYPYSREALWKFLGHKTEACCCLDIAVKMAKESLLRGRALVDGNVVGVGITATIATNRILHGKHRAYIALDDGKRC